MMVRFFIIDGWLRAARLREALTFSDFRSTATYAVAFPGARFYQR